jgi:hypothetical protein
VEAAILYFIYLASVPNILDFIGISRKLTTLLARYGLDKRVPFWVMLEIGQDIPNLLWGSG